MLVSLAHEFGPQKTLESTCQQLRLEARGEDFDLLAYAAQSFGVFQEEPIDVVLRFEPEAADDAARWMFHPTQRVEREPGGSLIVRFRSGASRKCAGSCLLGEPLSASSSRRNFA